MSIHRRRTKGGRVHWQVRWREGGRAGQNRQATFDTKRDAETFETARRRAKQLGQLSAEVIGSEQQFSDFISEWWETYALVRLRPGTLASYAYELDRWIVPFLGEISLREFSRATVDGYVAALVSAGAGAPTVNRCLAITQGIFQRALQWGRVATNPVAGVARLQHARDARITAQPADKVEAIRRVLDRQDAALVSVLAYEGLRPGEAFALTWQHVLDTTFEPRNRLLVERALSDHRLAPTKSARVREPELFVPVGEELAALYAAVEEPTSTHSCSQTAAEATFVARTGVGAFGSPPFGVPIHASPATQPDAWVTNDANPAEARVARPTSVHTTFATRPQRSSSTQDARSTRSLNTLATPIPASPHARTPTSIATRPNTAAFRLTRSFVARADEPRTPIRIMWTNDQEPRLRAYAGFRKRRMAFRFRCDKCARWRPAGQWAFATHAAASSSATHAVAGISRAHRLRAQSDSIPSCGRCRCRRRGALPA